MTEPKLYQIYFDEPRTGFRVDAEKYGGDLQVSYEPKVDKTYFVVVVQYTDGDSFGSYPEQFQYVDMYETEEDAVATALAIRKHNDWGYNSDRPNLQYKLHNGAIFASKYASWTSYFASLDIIHVIPTRKAFRGAY